jgi:predicted acyl esterase
MFPVLSKQTASMATQDGIRLDAAVFVPDASGKFPVLLMRQPSGGGDRLPRQPPFSISLLSCCL